MQCKFCPQNYPKITRLKLGVILGIVLFSFIAFDLRMDYTGSVLLGENYSVPYVAPSAGTHRILRQDVKVCFTNISQYLSDRNFLLESNETIAQSGPSSINGSNESSIFALLSSFNNVLSLLGIKGAIIEPSVLHCMIHPHYQEILSKRHFNVTKTPLSRNVMTYGILGSDVALLQQNESIANFSEAGFIANFVSAPVADWMLTKTTSGYTNATTFVSHIFYKHLSSYTIHVVVFYDRGTYLWHSSLDHEGREKIAPETALHFVKHSGAYEKFSFLSLESEASPLPVFHIPSTSHYFLLETLSSRFLECNSSRNNSDQYSALPKSHSGMSGERFNSRTVIALRQLKSIFHPLLMNFWIWSGTMLGWYRECDIIPYTSDVDFGAWASEVEDLSFIVHLLLNNKHMQIKELMGMPDEALELNIACYGLRADVFFLYRVKNGSWCSGHKPSRGYYFRYYYPHFSLCSADLLGEKVQVPCETEEVIRTEYGPDWRTPVSTWHYESSIKNRGPNIYWDKEKIKVAYRGYY